MKRNKLLVILLSVLMMFSFTMCKSKTMNTYNPYSKRYGISSDEDLKNIYWICMRKMICLQ